MNSNFRNLAIWVVIGLLLMALFNLFQNPGQRRRGNEISYRTSWPASMPATSPRSPSPSTAFSGIYRDKSATFTTNRRRRTPASSSG